MNRFIIGLVAGLIFGLGLALSDMVDPDRVLSFLDIAGAWDPTLGFVMGGALVPMALAWRIYWNRQTPTGTLALPPAGSIDSSLLAGAALFGTGWGLAGLCPGPAIALIGIMAAGNFSFSFGLVVFLGAMALGMTIHQRVAVPGVP